MNLGKVATLESMVLAYCIILLEHVIKMQASCFDTDFVSQIKLTELPLIYCFDRPIRSTFTIPGIHGQQSL